MNAAVTRVRLVQAESALAVARQDAAAAATVAAAAADSVLRSIPDSLRSVSAAQRDSLDARIRRIDTMLTRAEQAPLPSSYKALAELPELSGDARVRALVDSLSEIEREREAAGTLGGVDPVFVALTSRANEIGRAVQAIADERRKSLRSELVGLQPAALVVVRTAASDTTLRLAERDSLGTALAGAAGELTRLRESTRAIDLEEEREREQASAVAPPLALLASAFVLSAVIGFAFALVGELRKPRVSDANELERYLGMRVLSTVETPMPSVERGRRQADRSAPPYFDPGAEGYQLAYLGLATEHPTVLMATITGDDPRIAAVVACNLAAIAADEARNTLVVDLDSSCSASAALRARAQPGIVDILGNRATWPDATVAARVGRDKTVDLVPYGVASRPRPIEEVSTLLRHDGPRLARYYDAVLFLAAASDVAAGLPAAIPSAEVVFCAQPGITPLRQLREQLDQMRAAGGLIRGIVLWNAERPMLPTPSELVSRHRRSQPTERPVVAATP